MNFYLKGHVFKREIRTSLQYPDGKILIFFEPEKIFAHEYAEIFAREQENLPLQLPEFAASLKNGS